MDLGIAHTPEGRLLFPNMTVWENLAMGAYPKARRAHLAEGLDWVYRPFPRLKERARQVVRTMSGGEQQMVAIRPALMARPSVLLVDEPSLGLAPLLLANLFSVLREINRAGVTVPWWSRTCATPSRSRTAPTCWRPAASCWKAPRRT